MPRAKNNNQNNSNQNEVESTKTKQTKNEVNSEVATKVAKEDKQEAVIKNKNKDSEKVEEQATKKASSMKAEDYVLSVVQTLDQSRINVDRLRIEVDGNTVFAMKDGKLDNGERKIDEKQAELLKTALKDPLSLKGTVTITKGSKVLLKVENGRVITDSLGLTKDESAKIDIKSPEPVSEEAYKRYSEGVKEQGLAGSQKIAENALNDGVGRDKVAEMMKNYNADYQKLANKTNDKTAEVQVVAQAEVDIVQSQMRPSAEKSQAASKALSR